MDKQDKQITKQADGIDTTRRELLGKAGKAAWVTPTLVFLSFTAANAQAGGGPPDPPSACLPHCPHIDSQAEEQELQSERKSRRD